MLTNIHYDPRHMHFTTAEKATEWLLLAVAAAHGWPVEHFDIVDAYVHEPAASPQPIYVQALPEWAGRTKRNRPTGLLLKNLWGGKSAGYNYIQPLFRHLKKDGFVPADSDPCFFTKRDNGGITAVTVTVDDFLATATTTCRLDSFDRLLSRNYTVKCLGTPRTYLGWTVQRALEGAITIGQPSLAPKKIQQAKLQDSNGKHTPYASLQELHPPDGDDDELDDRRADSYRTLVGDLRYMADSTRPDLSYATGKVGSALQRPTERHWRALKAAIRYLQAKVQKGLGYAAGQKRKPDLRLLQAYTDAKFAGDKTDRKSTSGPVSTYNGGAVSWASRKQSLVAQSTAEAEHIALASALTSLITTKRLLTQSQLMPHRPTAINTDNTATRDMLAKPQGTKRRKFIDLGHHLIQDNLKRYDVHIEHVPVASQKADMFTKPLGRSDFGRQCGAIGLQQALEYGGV